MAINVPKPVLDMLAQVGMTQKQAMWNCHGTWVMYHKSLEKLAAYKKLTFDIPELIHQDLTKKEVVLLVTGHCDGVSEWSYGEATPSNNKNAYPFAMAEKRAKDRVVLKLLGFHGDIYSDAEIDNQVQEELASKAKRQKEDGGSLSKPTHLLAKKEPEVVKTEENKPEEEVKDADWYIENYLDNITNNKALDDFWRKHKKEFQRDSDLCTQMMRACAEKRIYIQEKDAYLSDLNNPENLKILNHELKEQYGG